MWFTPFLRVCLQSSGLSSVSFFHNQFTDGFCLPDIADLRNCLRNMGVVSVDVQYRWSDSLALSSLSFCEVVSVLRFPRRRDSFNRYRSYANPGRHRADDFESCTQIWAYDIECMWLTSSLQASRVNSADFTCFTNEKLRRSNAFMHVTSHRSALFGCSCVDDDVVSFCFFEL